MEYSIHYKIESYQDEARLRLGGDFNHDTTGICGIGGGGGESDDLLLSIMFQNLLHRLFAEQG